MVTVLDYALGVVRGRAAIAVSPHLLLASIGQYAGPRIMGSFVGCKINHFLWIKIYVFDDCGWDLLAP